MGTGQGGVGAAPGDVLVCRRLGSGRNRVGQRRWPGVVTGADYVLIVVVVVVAVLVTASSAAVVRYYAKVLAQTGHGGAGCGCGTS